MKEILQRRGHHSRLANSGQQALELLHAHSFDIVLMDVQMPGMDGLEATRQLRESGMETPVIAITAYVTEDDRNRCLAAGMNDYLSKPVNIQELIGKLEIWAGTPELTSQSAATATHPALNGSTIKAANDDMQTI